MTTYALCLPSAIWGDRGQSTDDTAASFHTSGLPLIPGHIEIVTPGDPLAGTSNENVGKIKLYAWRGPDFVTDPDVDVAGVDWILAEKLVALPAANLRNPSIRGLHFGSLHIFSRRGGNTNTPNR